MNINTASDGCAIIHGCMPCIAVHALQSGKNKSLTIETELFLGQFLDENNNLGAQVIKAIVHYFAQTADDRPRNGDLYYVHGKAINVSNDTVFPPGCDASSYALEIQAFEMLRIPSSNEVFPLIPTVSVSGVPGRSLNDREFLFEIRQYATKPQQYAAFKVTLLSDPRWKKFQPPHTTSSYTITGKLIGGPTQVGSVRALPLQVIDYSPLALPKATNLPQNNETVPGASTSSSYWSTHLQQLNASVSNAINTSSDAPDDDPKGKKPKTK